MKIDTKMMNGQSEGPRRRERKGGQHHNETVGICEDGTSETADGGLGGLFWLPGM